MITCIVYNKYKISNFRVNRYRFKVDSAEVVTSRRTTLKDSNGQNDSNSSESFCATDSKEPDRKNDLSNLMKIFLVMNLNYVFCAPVLEDYMN